jgi:hypothetical protein
MLIASQRAPAFALASAWQPHSRRRNKRGAGAFAANPAVNIGEPIDRFEEDV